MELNRFKKNNSRKYPVLLIISLLMKSTIPKLKQLNSAKKIPSVNAKVIAPIKDIYIEKPSINIVGSIKRTMDNIE